ncbi:polysaccharide biosynthesis tyrosine autokinase [Granulicoccus sp. GXG6511]|uniref:polysaccharide biosynthesis tyrosine autokinase n=1 Tax=Granulicoccus sp. GXG6511 TaxID=3381351 RepID=UPI003D7DEC28
MDVQDQLSVVRRYWRSTAATLLIVIALAATLSLLQARTWTASASVFVSVENGGSGEPGQGVNAERLIKSFVEVARSPFVLQPVLDSLQLDATAQDLIDDVAASSPEDTSVIEISAARPDAREAADVANGAAESLVRAIAELSPRGTDNAQVAQATIIERAVLPTSPTSPSPTRNLLLGLLLGMLLGLGQALLRDRLDRRVRTAGDIARITDSSVVGAITNQADATDHLDPASDEEAFRALRTNLGFLRLGGQRRSSLVFTSALAGEGKTATVTRLAKMLAKAGHRVLLIDADLRHPSIMTRFGLEDSLGLSYALSGQASAWELVRPGVERGLDVLGAGAVPPNPEELLASEAMCRFLRSAEVRYDYVLLDAPPLLPVADAAVLATQVGGAIVVVRSGVVSERELATALATLADAGGQVVGIVLNDLPSSSNGSNGAPATGLDRRKVEQR